MAKQKIAKEDIKGRLETEIDFINSPKHNYSLSTLLSELDKKDLKGVNDQFAASLLAISVEEFREIFQSAIKKYRQSLKIDVD